jgi:hypothetical protein
MTLVRFLLDCRKIKSFNGHYNWVNTYVSREIGTKYFAIHVPNINHMALMLFPP